MSLALLHLFDSWQNSPNEVKSGTTTDKYTVEDMLTFSKDIIPTSLLKLNSDHASRAVKIFSLILKYMGESGEPVRNRGFLRLPCPEEVAGIGFEAITCELVLHIVAGKNIYDVIIRYEIDYDHGGFFRSRATHSVSPQEGVTICNKLLREGLKRPELRDELYAQLSKQTRNNPNLRSNLKVPKPRRLCGHGKTSRRAWELMHLVAATMPPSKDFVSYVSEYIHDCAHDPQQPPEVRVRAGALQPSS
eukprot:1193556-Prorocentrum_minimum.AAC.5